MSIPHLVQYQGSKRNIAAEIIQFFPNRISRLIEPFCGTAAISILAAQQQKADKFILNDINKPLIDLLELCVNAPEKLFKLYENIWNGQFESGSNHINYFYKMRDKFNQENDPALMLFMLARIVKGSVRYNSNGELNQSCDKRRYGTKPQQMKKNAFGISALLYGKTEFFSKDYKEIICFAQQGDLVYMDPPYQGTCNKKDNRYYQGINFNEFVMVLQSLNDRNIDYIVSYDGMTGDKKHGKNLPEYLNLTHILIDSGQSSQATLLGKKEITYESLYLSKNLQRYYENKQENLILYQ